MIANLLSNFFIGAAETVDLGRPRDPKIAKMFGMGASTLAGVPVDNDTVLALPAVVRAANIVSNGVKKLPFYVFREEAEGREWDRTHAAWRSVTRKPNKDFTIGPFKKTLTYWAMLWGNGCAYIDAPNWPDGPIELIPLLPDRTQPVRERGGEVSLDPNSRGDLYYATKIAGVDFKFPADKVIHIRGLGPNPYWGHNVVDILRETFGGALAVNEFGHRFFGGGANPAGFIEMPSGMDEEAEVRFVESLKKASTGLSRAHKFAVLEEGAKFHQLTTTPDNAQFLETKTLDIRLLAMALGCKVHKLIDGANSAFKSLEQANQEHKDDDLMPWVDTWREELSDKLLTEQQLESGSHSIDVDDEYLEWVPFSERSAGVVELYNNGVIHKDEARRKVNFGPSRTPYAMQYRKPMNIEVEGQEQDRDTSDEPPMPPIDNTARERKEIATAYLDRIWRKTEAQAIAKAKKGIKPFAAWVVTIKTEVGPGCLQNAIDTMLASIADDLEKIADRCTDVTIEQEIVAYCEFFTSTTLYRFAEPKK